MSATPRGPYYVGFLLIVVAVIAWYAAAYHGDPTPITERPEGPRGTGTRPVVATATRRDAPEPVRTAVASGELAIVVRDKRTGRAIKGAQLLEVRTVSRVLDATAAEEVAVSDEDGALSVPRDRVSRVLAPGGTAFVLGARAYATIRLDTPAAWRPVVNLDPCESLTVRAVRESDGAPVPGVRVSLSRIPIWQPSRPSHKCLPSCNDASITSDESAANGVLVLGGLQARKYWISAWHPHYAIVTGIAKDHRVEVPGSLTLRLRRKIAVAVRSTNSRIRGFRVAPTRASRSLIDRTTRAWTEDHQRLEAQHPGSAVFVRIPTRRASEESANIQVRFHVLLESGAFLSRTFDARPLCPGFEPYNIDAELEGTEGTLTVVLRDATGAPLEDVPLIVFGKRLYFTARCNRTLNLPAGAYQYSVGMRASGRLFRNIGRQEVTIGPGASESREHRVLFPITRCRIEPVFPWKQSVSTNYQLVLTEANERSQVMNWNPKARRDTNTFFLAPGRVEVKLMMLGMRGSTTFDVTQSRRAVPLRVLMERLEE